MKKRSKADDDSLRQKIIGLGQNSVRKTYFREYQENQGKLERFNALLSKIHDSIFIVDLKNQKIVETHVTDEEIFGRKQDEFVGVVFMDLFVYKDRIALKDYLSLPASEDTFKILTQVSSKYNLDQNYVDINIDTNQFSGEEFAVAIVRNVNERIQTAKRLELSESNLKSIIEYTSESIWSVDKQYKLLTYNSNFQTQFEFMSGYKVRKGDMLLNTVRPEEADWWRERYNIAFNGRTVDDELKVIIGGVEVYSEVQIYPIYNKDIIVGAGVFVKDITDKKDYQKEIERNKQAMDSSKDGMAILDREGNFTYLNNAHIYIYGYDNKDELIGKSWALLYNDTELNRLMTTVMPQFFETGYWRGETIGKCKDGSLFNQEISLNLLESGDMVCVVRNIDERKQAEKELREAKDAAEKSDRLKTEFLAQMSHEIRTPINTMLSFIGLLREEFKDYEDDNINTGFQIIKNSGVRIIRTIDLLLNMSELSVGAYDYVPRDINICEDILDDLFLEYKLVAKEKGIDLKLDNCSCGACTIKGDAYSITKIFDNLINNAVKYTESGSITLRASSNNANVMVDVADTGIGISDEYMDNLFEPFTQEEQGYTRKFEGNGLGLALVKKYCELNNAEIVVESEKGKGSVFSVIFKNKAIG